EKLEVNGTIKAQGLKLNNLSFKYESASGNIPEKITWGSNENAPVGSVGIPVFPSNCLDPLSVDRYNVMTGAAVFKSSSIAQGGLTCKTFDPTFYVGLYGCDGALEVVQDGTILNSGSTSDLNKLLINTHCGRDVVVGRTDGGNLIVNHNLGVGIVDPNARLHVSGTSILDGNVRIGNTSSTASNYGRKLVVEGIVYSREFRVTDSQAIWPDFVFSKNHKLISLKELQTFIEKESHLPGIPSAKEVEQSGGFSVNEMLIKLLQKQEETTLYLLQLHDKIAQLEKENEALKEAIK
ncbi:MAG TPA: hypothetical protein PK323_14970, partial [Bacteroidia bacterium]|nr:hypothetical protein [Bacteroidia bacterium]